MKKTLVIILSLSFLFVACKKESKDPENAESNNPVSPVADFTITASDINYSVGTMWIYNVTNYEAQYVNISSSNPSLSYSNTTTGVYTVTVTRDTIIGAGITGKILDYSGTGFNSNNYIREISYYDPVDVKWHDISYISFNGGPETVECFGIDLPLTPNSAWENTHASHPSSATDSCYAHGFDNVSYNGGNVKCIKFNKIPVNNYYGTYWYNPTYGKVRTEVENAQISGQTYTIKSSTITLTSFLP